MKKLICMLLAVALLIPLAACGGGSSSSSETGTYYFSEVREVFGDYSGTITKQEILSNPDFSVDWELIYHANSRLEIYGNGKAKLSSTYAADGNGAPREANYNSNSLWFEDNGETLPFSLKNGVATIRNNYSNGYYEWVYRKK